MPKKVTIYLTSAKIDHVAELKKFKVPFWSVWLGDCRAWRRARKARNEERLVATVTIWAKYRDEDDPRRGWVNLYETGSGKRRFEFTKGTLKNGIVVAQYEEYQEAILPWLHHNVTSAGIIKFANHTTTVPKWTDS